MKTSHIQELELELLGGGILREPLFILELGGRKPTDDMNRGREPFYSLKHTRINIFDADEAEARRLNEHFGKDDRMHVSPFAVGKGNETRNLYLTKTRGSSSLYRPNDAVVRNFVDFDDLKVEEIISVQTRSLDWIAKEEAWPEVDFVKMDIQGAELEALEGGQNCLSGVLGIVTEVWFARPYEGQPTFAELHLAMEKLGLEFHHRLDVGSRAIEAGVPGQQQELWGDVLYLRNLSALEENELARIAVIAALYGCHHIVVKALNRLGGETCKKIARNYQASVQALDRRQQNRLRRMLQILRYGHTWT